MEINKIIQEMSLWKPQKLALIKLNSILSSIDLSQDRDTIKASIIGKIDFDTKFPSFTFDMATGTGKTKLMAACIAYLFQKGESKNFFILTPGETIYRKTITDFTKGHKRFEFKGWSDIPDFELITGENYESYNPTQTKLTKNKFTIFIFNIDKFRRKDKETLKFHRFREILGGSFGELLARIPDLVLLMDESHHYRADITKEAIEGLKPILGLEFTATPIYKKNIIYSYSLGDAVQDGLIKRLEAVIRKNDRSYEEELEELKLLDGLKIHMRKKVYVEEYCKNNNKPRIKPVVFISTKNIKHGEEIQKKLESKDFMKGEFIGKTIFVHSGSDDEQIQELLKLEEANKKEVVIHVNKLKEGWDVKTIYTIIPLRASISEILVEQTIGRGVRLPFYEVSKEEMERDEKAFTLSVITYKLKGDNYKDVISAANQGNIVVKDYDEDEDKNRNLVLYEVKPTSTKHKIDIPKLKGIIKVTGSLKFFDIEPRYTETKKIKSELEGIDLTKETSETIGEATQTTIDNQYNYLLKMLIEKMDEINSKDKETVEKIIKVYLKKATKTESVEKWEELLKMHRSLIFEDIKNQIQEKINEMIKVKHDFELENFVFTSYFTNIDKDTGIKDKDSILDEEIKHTVSTGYKKSLYTENKFDSQQEKWFADILDRDADVKKWLKNPRNQVSIRYKFGNYYPDFIVETEKEVLLVEVKSSAELNKEDVLEKAKEADNWCDKVSKITGKNWSYKLLPHDKINRQDSFKATISNVIEHN
jgi:type III restriction enzyme